MEMFTCMPSIHHLSFLLEIMMAITMADLRSHKLKRVTSHALDALNTFERKLTLSHHMLHLKPLKLQQGKNASRIFQIIFP